MAEPFTLTAIPQIISDTTGKKHLEFLQFVATDGSTIHQWWSANVGTYAEDFGTLMTLADANAVLVRLRSGETVTMPGFWSLE